MNAVITFRFLDKSAKEMLTQFGSYFIIFSYNKGGMKYEKS